MYTEVLQFWFEEIDESRWWVKDLDFDNLIIKRFSKIHDMASKCELFEWRDNAEGRLAEIIVLDQFSRNIFRDSPLAFANDALALALSQTAITLNVDQELESQKKSFLYMPFMHSESPKIHETAVELYTKANSRSSLEFELKHKTIVDRFGRYPHRNNILNRESTPEEI